MQRQQIPVCVLPETRTVGTRVNQWIGGFTLHNSSALNNRGGIGFLTSNQIKIGQFLPVSERLAALSFEMIGMKIIIIGCYAPTLSAKQEAVEKFYSGLERTIARVQQWGGAVILAGDFNTRPSWVTKPWTPQQRQILKLY